MEHLCRPWMVLYLSYLSSTSPETLSARFIIPERLAVPQLGRVRELLLREARLLDALSHSCVVPLESGWLEQRTDFEDPHVCACTTVRCGYPPSGRARNRAEGVREASESASMEESESGEDGGCSCRELSFNAPLSVSGGDDDVATCLLRSWVPLTLEDVDGDDSDAHQDEEGGLATSYKGISSDGRRDILQYGDLEQLRWGGDDKTNWRGTAEPKPTAHRTPFTPPTEITLDRKTPVHSSATCECLCSCACGRGYSVRRRERALSFASYLLLPDWLPLSVWFETEFEPRTASSDAHGGAGTTRAVTAPDDWTLVWRHLLSMFVQVRPFPF